MSGNVIALRKVFIEVLRSSTNGSLTGYLSEPQSTECSSMWNTPVLSSGRVLNPTEKSLFSSPLSAHTSFAPVASCSISTSLPPISFISRMFVTVKPCILSFTVICYAPVILILLSLTRFRVEIPYNDIPISGAIKVHGML